MKKKTMALIKCKECGFEVSDKAFSCPNCGSPIEKEIVCSECGEKLGPNDKVCPKCGCPVPADSSEKTAMAESATVDDSDERLQKVQSFLALNRKFLPQECFDELRSQLLNINKNQWATVEHLKFKDPSTVLIVSILVGWIGIDRFMLEDTLNGVLKIVLTCLCGLGFIWWLIDLFLIQNITLKYNYKLLTDTLGLMNINMN